MRSEKSGNELIKILDGGKCESYQNVERKCYNSCQELWDLKDLLNFLLIIIKTYKLVYP